MNAAFRMSRTPALALALLVLASTASGQDKADRVVRRLQLQLQNLQQQLQEAQAGKARAEADKADTDRKLADEAKEIPRAQAAARESGEALKSSRQERSALAERVAVLEKQLAEQKRAGDDAVAAKDVQLATLVRTRDSQQSRLQAKFDNEVAQVTVCADRNQRLLQLGADLLDRYRRKGVAEIASQHDPLLGLGDVKMFNLVQDTRDRLDAERLVPAPPGEKPQP